MTTTVLRTADDWFVRTAAGAVRIETAATTTAELHRVRGPLPALAAWTPASPSSRAAKEAARLHQTLTTP